MAAIASSNVRLGSILKYEDRPEVGLCRQDATVLVATGMKIGAVVQSDGDGTYSWVTNAAVATLSTDVGIVIDVDVEDMTAGDQIVTIMNLPVPGANAGIAQGGLLYADTVTAPNQVIVEAALTARGFQILTQV